VWCVCVCVCGVGVCGVCVYVVCGCVCVGVCVCVGGGTYLVETMSWNVLEVAWKAGLFVEWVIVCCQLFCDWSIALAVYF